MKSSKDAILFTPGPLTTTLATKKAMLKDWGSRDTDFQLITQSVCQQLLNIAQVETTHVCVPMQGSGTFSVESAITTLTNKNSKILVPVNGAYCERIITICNYLGRQVVRADFYEDEPINPQKIDNILSKDPDIDFVAIVHCETTTGILNPLEQIAKIVKSHHRKLMIDAISTFGAIEINPNNVDYDALVGSSNKCLESVPGVGFVLCKKDSLLNCQANANSLSLDLYAQWQYMNKTRQWRFTPPTQVIVALQQALVQYENQGGLKARYQRYYKNHQLLVSHMRRLGFTTFLKDENQSPIITTFYYPDSELFSFDVFYQRLKEQGYIIYPGKLTNADTFRIGSIGCISEIEMLYLIKAIEKIMIELNIRTNTKEEEIAY